MIDWTAIATFGLASVTFALVAQTWWFRRIGERERVSRALRAAAYEQLDNLRRWEPLDVDRSQGATIGALLDAAPNFDSAIVLVRDVDLTEELATYLIWLIGDTRERIADMAYPIERVLNGQSAWTNVNVAGDWRVVFDRVQVLLCLVQAEASRRRAAGTARLGAGTSWVRPRVSEFRSGNRVADQVYLLAPVFPRDRAYAGCDIGPRSEAAAEYAAAEQERINRSWVDAGLTPSGFP